MNLLNKINIFIFCMISSCTIYSQTSTSSPYSRYGLGDLQANIMSEYAGLGGGSTSAYHLKSINPYNAASYTAFGSKSFLFSTGLSHQTTSMQKSDLNQITNNTSFTHLIMGFPLSKKLGASIGIIPFSNVGYEFSSNEISSNNAANFIYSGDGGISKIYFGAAYEIIQGLSMGVNASYLFGGINRLKKVEFYDNTIFSTRSNTRTNLKGYNYEFGLIYNKNFVNNRQFTFGITANNDQNTIGAKQVHLVETYELSGDFINIKDTAVNSTFRGDAVLPRFFSLGATLRDGKKWLLTADYSIQNWSDYSIIETNDSLANSVRYSAGLQFTPDNQSLTSFVKRIRYRLGFSYSQTPLEINNLQLEQRSITAGFGIPIRKNRTTYNVFIELGERGTVESNLIKEHYARFGVSFNFDSIWFVKQKYD